jgi:hypothetical protein
MPEQGRDRDTECFGDPTDVDERGIPLSPLNPPNVGPMQVAKLSELLLGETKTLAQRSNSPTKRLW